jgi:trk system potassium uptake protein TrkA
MRVIIMGCGRVGEALSRIMLEDGHDVTVIDYDQAALDRLGLSFKGQKVLGVGFDREVLLRAGIEQTDAFAATSSSDSANIVAARVARNIFQVPRVVARLFDPRRAEIYRRLGLITVSSTTWGAERLHELLTHRELDSIIAFGNGEVSLLRVEMPLHLIGRVAQDLTVPGEVSVVSIVRDGEAILPLLGTEFREGDIVYLATLASSMERLENLLGLTIGAEV